MRDVRDDDAADDRVPFQQMHAGLCVRALS